MDNCKIVLAICVMFVFFQTNGQDNAIITQSNSLLASGKSKEAFLLLNQEEKKAANKDLAYQVGLFYQQGIGTVKNDSLANLYFLKAAGLNHIESQKMLAFRYMEGIGFTKNTVKSFEMFQKCAEKNDDCKINVINCYSEGIGVAKNLTTAIDLAKAFVAKHKNTPNGILGEVCFFIANKYYQGDGVFLKKDYSEALKWILITHVLKESNSTISSYSLRTYFQNCKKELPPTQFEKAISEATSILGVANLDYKGLQ